LTRFLEICKEDDKFYLIFVDGGIVAHFAKIKGFYVREDLVYRNKMLTELKKSAP